MKALASTRTLQGITTKNFLAALHTDQLWQVDRRMVDVRRVRRAATAEELEVGITPYHPVLPLLHQQLVSYNLTVRCAVCR